MLKLVSYLRASKKYPLFRDAGLLAGGRGIIYRRKKFRSFWNSHLERSRAFVRDHVGTGDTLTILGAGSLFDIDLEHLVDRYKKITLVDADPLLLPRWREEARPYKGCEFEFLLRDISGGLIPVQREILQKASSGLNCAETVSALRELQLPPPDPFPPSDIIISLNILSQLPFGVEEITKTTLHRFFSKRLVAEHLDERNEGFAHLANAVIKNHLTSLNSSLSLRILLLTDVEYLFYSMIGKRAVEDNLLVLSAGEVILNPSLHGVVKRVEKMDALYETNLLDERFQKEIFSNYEIVHRDPWLWDVLPEATGEIHKVVPFLLERVNSRPSNQPL